MGFYGNVTNTSKTTFSFDLIYTTRSDMDLNANIDGVFLGRYVLIDYGEDPIKGYYYEGKFYNTALHADHSAITGRENAIYQDLHNSLAANSFYRYTKKDGFQPISTNSAYQERFAIDVKAYGRGYDSTVWVKRYDEATAAYKYVMIAELNAVVPTFHMVVNEPNAIPTTPYFDRDTTNIDYYLHMQSDFGNRVKKAHPGVKSDEQATRIMTKWVNDNSGYQVGEAYSETVDADIYYNNDGFDSEVRHLMDQTSVPYAWMDDNGKLLENKVIDYTKNAIGYEMGQSGRLYGADADLGVYQQGYQADDVYDWYIRLPGIGNAICRMWDKVYNDRGNNRTRALNKALMRNDSNDHLVTYDKLTVMGMINTTQDLLGYHFIKLEDPHIEGAQIEEPTFITVTLNPDHNIDFYDKEEHTINSYEATYEVLDCLFYTQDEAGRIDYYQYAYDPIYDVAAEIGENGKYYYKEVDEKGNEIFHFANAATYTAKDANGKALNYETYYTRRDRWTLKKLEWQTEDSLYALINNIHKIIGTNSDDTRNIGTMIGCINIIRDIISNIHTPLVPGKLLHTTNEGKIATTDTYFPGSDWDEGHVLDAEGNWVSRLKTITILKNSENANQQSVNTYIWDEDTGAPKLETQGTLTSDNQLVKTAAEDGNGYYATNKQLHAPNNFTFGTSNKWIELQPHTQWDSLEFTHSVSPINTRLRSEQITSAEEGANTEIVNMCDGTQDNGNVILKDVTGYKNFSTNEDATEIRVEPTTDTLSYVNDVNDQNDNRLTIPYIIVDNAGHVVELGTKNFNVPHTFKYLTITDNNTDDFEVKTSHEEGTLEADQLTDTWHISPQNRWIDITADAANDTVKFGHIYSTLAAHDFMDDIEIDDDIDGKSEHSTKDCKFTFPMPITDNAGHIVDYATNSIYIPYNFRDIVVADIEGTMDDDSVQTKGKLEADKTTDSWTFASQNPWIRIAADPETDKITIGHSHSSQLAHDFATDVVIDDDIDGTSEHSTKDCVYTIPLVETDNAGHIIGYSTKSIYIPYNYRNITLNAQSSYEGPIKVSDGTQSADSTTDTFAFGTGNQWIEASIDEDQITFAHALIDDKANQKWEFKSIATDGWQSASEDGNKLTIPTFEIDNAGHIVRTNTADFYIPNNFRNIAVADATGADVNATQNSDILEADSTVDGWTIASQNQWLRIAADVDKDQVTIGHSYSEQSAHNFADDVKIVPALDGTTQKDNEIIFPTLKTDNAGHIIGYQDNTFYIPHTFKNIHLLAQSTAKTAVAASDTTVEMDAENIVDTFTFATGNKWVQTTGDVTNDRITFSHILSGVTANTYGTNDATALAPQFGETFLVPGYTVDEAGHITSASTHTVKIPQNRYENDDKEQTTANVITGMSLNQTSGLITTTSQNIGTLSLTGYELGTTASAAVAATDTLNKAIAKIEAQVKAEASARDQADKDLQTNITNEGIARGEAITAASQAIWKDLLENFNLTLQSPRVNNISMTPIQDNPSVKLETSVIEPVENDTYIYTWSNGVTGRNSIEVTTAGKYTCKVKRIHNGFESSEVTVEINVNTNDIPTPPDPEPDQEPEVPEA